MVQAVAALLQKDPSAIVTLKKSGLARPRDLDGKARRSASFLLMCPILPAKAE